MKFRFRIGLIAITLALVQATTATTLLRGTAQSIGEGTAYSYMVLNRQRRPTEVGVVLSESALSNLPSEETKLNLDLPRQRRSNLPFTHVGLNWNPQGHLPPPIYGTPHFDYHFYTFSQAERRQITATGEDLARVYKTPDARYVPTGYVLAP